MVDIIRAACYILMISKEDLAGRTRIRHVVEARHIIFHIARFKTKFSLAKIGAALYRDHSTVNYGIQNCVDLLETNRAFAKKYKDVLDYVKYDLKARKAA
jgi:chromosomal replication initiation ATPase DnaA